MKSLFLALTLVSPLAFGSTVGMVRKLIQFQAGSGSAPQQASPVTEAYMNFSLEALKHPLFVDVSLAVCGVKMASARNQQALDPAKMTDVIAFNSAISIMAATSVAHLEGADKFSPEELGVLITAAEEKLVLSAARGCVVGLSQISALRAQREGKVSEFVTEFNTEVIQVTKNIIAAWETADPKATETYNLEFDKMLTEIANKAIEQMPKTKPGGNASKTLRGA